MGGVLAALAIVAGAFGDHNLRRQLDEERESSTASTTAPQVSEGTRAPGKRPATPEERLQRFRTGTQYHLIHSVAIVLVLPAK